MSRWKSIDLSDIIPAKDAAEHVKDTAESILSVFAAVKLVLQTIRAFLLDLGNPIRALLQAIIVQIQTILNDLDQAGIYTLMVVPEPGPNGDYENIKGGIDNFVYTLQMSLEDRDDPNRPQFSAEASVGGFMLVADSGNIIPIIEAISSLLKLFGQKKEVTLPAPNPVAARLVGPGSQLISGMMSLAGLGDDSPDVMVQWSSTSLGNDWWVERSDYANGLPYIITRNVDGTFDPVPRIATSPEEIVSLTEDELVGVGVGGEVIRYFEPIGVVMATGDVDNPDVPDAANVDILTGITGFLTGTYRYIDDTIVATEGEAKTVYYRVRAVSGNPEIGVNSNGRLVVTNSDILGTPSYPMPVVIPPPGLGSIAEIVSTILCAGYNVGAPVLEDIDGNRGADIIREIAPILTPPDGFGAGVDVDRENTGHVRMATTKYFGSLLGSALGLTRMDYERLYTNVMATLYRMPSAWQSITNAYVNSMEQVNRWRGPGPLETGDPFINEELISIEASEADRSAIDTLVRMLVRYGVPTGREPNWITFRPLRDLLPPISELFNMLISELRAILEAYDSLIKSIVDAIDLLTARIQAIEALIKRIEALILEILSLRGGFYMLYVPEVNGLGEFISAIQQAEDGPISSPDAYTAGVVGVYGGPSIGSIRRFMELTFGQA